MNLDVKKIGIILSNLATAFLHLSLLPSMGPDPIALNGLGYLGLLGAYFMPMPMLQQNHKMVWWACSDTPRSRLCYGSSWATRISWLARTAPLGITPKPPKFF